MKQKNSLRYKFFKWALSITVFIAYSIISIHKSWNDDFRAYYQAGKCVLLHVNIYDKSIVEGGFLYSPFFALLMVPLSTISQYAAGTLWYFSNVTSLLFFIAIALYLNADVTQPFLIWLGESLKILNSNKPFTLIIVLVLILSARFWLNSIEHGQINLQLWVLVLGSIYFLKRNRIILASVVLSIAAVTKVLPALFLFYYLLKKRYDFVLFTLIFILLFLLIPAGILGWQHNSDLLTIWFNNVLSPGLTDGPIGVGDSNQSFPAMLIRFTNNVAANEDTGMSVNFFSLPPQSIGIITKFSILLFLSGIFASVVFTKQKTSLQENIELSIVFLSAALMPMLAWKAYYVVSIMGYTTVIYYFIKMRSIKTNRLSIALVIISFILHTLTSDGIWGWEITHIFQSHSCVTFSMLSLYASLLLILVQQKK